MRLAADVPAESVHFGERVLVAGAVCSGYAVMEAIESFFSAAQLRKGLGRHLIAGNVVGVVLNEGAELG